MVCLAYGSDFKCSSKYGHLLAWYSGDGMNTGQVFEWSIESIRYKQVTRFRDYSQFILKNMWQIHNKNIGIIRIHQRRFLHILIWHPEFIFFVTMVKISDKVQGLLVYSILKGNK